MLEPPLLLAAATQVLSPTDALTLLLTVESLLLAAFAVAAAFIGPRSAGGSPVLVGGAMALMIAVAITFVGAGAGAAWTTVYVDPGPANVAQWFEAVGLALGIAAEPIFAWAIWAAARG